MKETRKNERPQQQQQREDSVMAKALTLVCAFAAFLLVVCACDGEMAPEAGRIVHSDPELGGAAGMSSVGELAGVAGVGGQASPVSMGDAGAGGSSSSAVAPCCALVDPAVMPAESFGCWCVDLEQSECTQAYWDEQYRATPERPAPALIPSGQCPRPEGQVWCCVRHALDWRYPEERDGCTCELYTAEGCASMVQSLGAAAGGIRVEQCP